MTDQTYYTSLVPSHVLRHLLAELERENISCTQVLSYTATMRQASSYAQLMSVYTTLYPQAPQGSLPCQIHTSAPQEAITKLVMRCPGWASTPPSRCEIHTV